MRTVPPSAPHHRPQCEAEPRSRLQASHLSHKWLQTVVMTETKILFIFIHTGCDVGSAVFFNAHSMSFPPTTQVLLSCSRNCLCCIKYFVGKLTLRRGVATSSIRVKFCAMQRRSLSITQGSPIPWMFWRQQTRHNSFNGPTAFPKCHRFREGVIGGGVRGCAGNLLIRSPAQLAFPFTSLHWEKWLAWRRTSSRTYGGRTRGDTVAPYTYGVPICRVFFFF